VKKRSDFEGVELDWFAVDPEGFVALLSSAGAGPIPDAVFERFDEQRRIEEFLGILIGMGTLENFLRAQKLLSGAGVFTYDWKLWDGPYCRFNMPSKPKNLDELGLPLELRTALILVPERFAASAELRLQSIEGLQN
jgi:hypothetical protein